MGVQRYLIHDAEEGAIVAYAAPDAAEMLGTTTKTITTRATASDGKRAELRGWPPNTDVNPNRSWMIDAGQVDALTAADIGTLQAQISQLREELGEARGQADANRDEVATAAMERSEYRQAMLDAAVARAVTAEQSLEQTRAAVLALGVTVQELTNRLAGAAL